MFSSSIVPIITPFKDDYSIDYEILANLIEFHIQEGTKGIIPVGTTGESATLSYREHSDVVKFTIDRVNKRVPVIAGAGSNSTFEAIELVKQAEKDGADGILSITPYYNKPTQEGLIVHFTEIAKNTKLPIILYNVPGRTGVNMIPETVYALSKIDNIIGIKEASGNLTQAAEIIRLCEGRINVFCGEDTLAFPMMTIGAKGSIAATANVIPADFSSMVEEAEDNINRARALYYKIFPICKAMFLETNPAPVKEALYLMGLIPCPKVRLPLVGVKEKTREEIRSLLKSYGLVK
ncbi:TPA: 4-hydroxy-tetrahydrodipicolinate synthase [bacterium]|nr:4-hydroxy-tetrahydrodipicolinate synthase [bacterium]